MQIGEGGLKNFPRKEGKEKRMRGHQ
jgi:hypothetical protein